MYLNPRKIKIAAFFLMTSCGVLHAQNIKGTIVGSTNSTLPGASVSLVGDNIKTVTSLEGDFNILSPKLGEINLKIEYIGYKTVCLQTNLDILE